MDLQSANKKVKDLYGITTPEGKPFEVPLEGSMSLLALGYRGLMAWRAEKIEADQKNQQEKKAHGPGK